MKLTDIILNNTVQEDGSISIPKRAIKIKAEFLKEMYTHVAGTVRVNKGKIVDRCADMWTDKLGENLDVTVSEVYLDRHTLINVDTKEKVLSEINDSQLRELDIEQIAFSRAIAKISVPGLGEEISPAIAININEHGDEFAYGNNVHICSNLTIMRADNRLSTYEKIKGAGESFTKPSIEFILKQFGHFMSETKERFEAELKQIEEWKQRPVTRGEFFRFLGEQYSKIQWVNYNQVERKIKEIDDKFIAVNGLQLGRIAVEAQKPSYPEYQWDGDITSVWNIINMGTECLKFHRGSDSVTVLKANSNWVNLVSGYNFRSN